MAESLIEKKRKLRKVLKRMERRYGPLSLAPDGPDIGQCIYLVLRENWSIRKALRAWRKLLKDFIDWNEVRVSTHKEIRESIEFTGYPDLDDKIDRIKGILDGVFERYNRLQLDFLKEQDFDETRKFFVNLAPLGKANAYIFLQCLQNEPTNKKIQAVQNWLKEDCPAISSVPLSLINGLIKCPLFHDRIS